MLNLKKTEYALNLTEVVKMNTPVNRFKYPFLELEWCFDQWDKMST